MFLRSVNPLVRAVAGMAWALALMILQSAHQGHAAEGPFTNMTGSWSGPGTITVNNNKERLRCRAGYNVSNNGSTVDIQIRCASDSYKFDLQGGVNSNNGVLSGTWSESAHGAAGEIAGTVSGGVIRARATGPYFSAHLSLNTRGNSQSVSLNAPGSQISSVSITLNKSGATAAR